MANTHKNFNAGADLSANIYRYVKFDGSGDLVVATAGDKMVGIQTNKPLAGEPVGLAATGGQAKLKIGGTVTRGDFLKSDATGRGVATAAGGDIYGCMALESGVTNDIINVEVVVATLVHA